MCVCLWGILSVEFGRAHGCEEDFIRDAGDDCDGVVELENDGAYVAEGVGLRCYVGGWVAGWVDAG